MPCVQPVNDAKINADAVRHASESTGDFVAGVHWALEELSPFAVVRAELWARAYAAALERKESWIRAEEIANTAVRAFDRRAPTTC